MTENLTRRISIAADGTKRIFDRLRHRAVALTPEELVRQTFVDYLIDSLGYPAGLMANEISITLNGTTRRCDSVLFDRNHHPVMIIEYKAPTVNITQKVFEQIARYNLILKAPYLVVANGRTCYCCRIDSDGTPQFLPGVPEYDALL